MSVYSSATGSAQQWGSVFDRLHDPTTYTGVYAERFRSGPGINDDADPHRHSPVRTTFQGSTNVGSNEVVHDLSKITRDYLNRDTTSPHSPRTRASLRMAARMSSAERGVLGGGPGGAGGYGGEPAGGGSFYGGGGRGSSFYGGGGGGDSGSAIGDSASVVAGSAGGAGAQFGDGGAGPAGYDGGEGVSSGAAEGPAGEEAALSAPLDTNTQLQLIFQYYCRFGRTGGAGDEQDTLDGANFAKLTRECPDLLDRVLNPTEVDLIFVKCKAKAARRLTYGQFLDALSAMATVRYHDVDDPVTAFSLLLANHVFQCPASVGIAAAVRSGMLQLTPVGGAGGVGASGYAVTATPGYGGGSSVAGPAAEAGSGSVYGGGGGGGGGGGSFYGGAPPAPSPGRYGTGAGPLGSPARPGHGATGVLSPSRGASGGGGGAAGAEAFSPSGRPWSGQAAQAAGSRGGDASAAPGGASAAAASTGAGSGAGVGFSGAPSGFIPVIALMPSPGAPGNAAMGVPPGFLPVQVLMPAPAPAGGAVGGAGATPAYPQQYPQQHGYPQQQQAAEYGSGAPAAASAGHASGLAGDVAGLLAAAGVTRGRQMAAGGFSEGGRPSSGGPSSGRRQRQPSITSLSSIGGGPGSSVYVGGGGASGGGMLSPGGMGPGGGAMGGAAPYMGSGASVVSYGGQSAVSGARRARSARPSRSPSRRGSMLGSPAFKPTVAGEANRPGGVYERLSSPDSFTGVYRRAWLTDGRINHFADTGLSNVPTRFEGHTNTGSNETIHDIRHLLRPSVSSGKGFKP